MDDIIKNVMSAVFKIPVDEINDNISIGTTKSWDSLQHLNFVVALEKELGVQFEDEEILMMLNYPSIKQIVSGKIKSNKS